jgi:hypothetical protein
MADIQPTAHAAADRFGDMQARLRENRTDDFVGAFVIFPPPTPGIAPKPIETVIYNSNMNAALFWSLLKSQAEMALAEIEIAERQSNVYGRR